MKHARAAGRCRRALIGQLEEARRELRLRHPSDDSVHAARKAIKKARAAVRLLREIYGKDCYRKINATLRDAGRLLAPLRDAKSMADGFSAFHARNAAQLHGADAAALAAKLGDRLRAQRRRLAREPATLRACKSLLAEACTHVTGLDLAGSRAAILKGMRRIYRRGRRTLAGARRAGTPRALHEWRKQVKYLGNAFDILKAASSARGAKLGKRADKLADALGEDHDLAELDRHFANLEGAPVEKRTRRTLSALIARRRAKLQKRAYALGAKIYAQTPGHFAPWLRAIIQDD